jgi:hypothetical protein
VRWRPSPARAPLAGGRQPREEGPQPPKPTSPSLRSAVGVRGLLARHRENRHARIRRNHLAKALDRRQAGNQGNVKMLCRNVAERATMGGRETCRRWRAAGTGDADNANTNPHDYGGNPTVGGMESGRPLYSSRRRRGPKASLYKGLSPGHARPPARRVRGGNRGTLWHRGTPH